MPARSAGRSAERALHDRRRRLRRAREQQHPPQHRGGLRSHLGIDELIVHLADVRDGGRRIHETLHQPELQQQLLALAPPGAAPRAPAAGTAPRSRSHLGAAPPGPRLAAASTTHGCGAGRRGEQLRCDQLGRGADVQECPCRALVQQLALRRGEVVIDGVAHQRVHEAERRLRPQDLRARQGASRHRDAVLVGLGHRRDGAQPGAVAEHRHGARHRDGVGRQSRETQQHGA